MKLFDLFTPEELGAQIEAKMVKATPHSFADLTIYNYTQVAQFNPELWNHVTDKCRGLIVDRDGNVVARGFEKFWNYGDSRHPETLPENLPKTPPLLTRKVDGSLGVGYKIAGEWFVATRGSFASEQAVWASKWLKKNCPNFDWPHGYTPLFEIVYPENQIVVKYDYSGLVLLASVRIKTGEEAPYSALTHWATLNELRIVKQFDKPLSECVTEDDPNEEGYVASWYRSGTTPLRVKIKYETYCRLHKLLTQTSAIGIWELLRDGKPTVELFESVPEEFKRWVTDVEANLIMDYQEIEDRAREDFKTSGFRIMETRKEFAEYAKSTKYPHLVFALKDGKNLDPMIWKMIRPVGNQATFKSAEEESETKLLDTGEVDTETQQSEEVEECVA